MGIKVDVGEPNSSSLCRITQPRISLWPELFRPAALPGLRLRGLEFDSYGGGGGGGVGGGCCNSQGLPFSGSGANCLNPLIKSSILLACNSQWKHLGRGKDPICPVPPPPLPLIWSGRTYSPPQPANTHALAWVSPRLCNIHADTYLDMKRACRANLLPLTAVKTKRALLSTSNAKAVDPADKNK